MKTSLQNSAGASFELIQEDGPAQVIPISPLPFRVGRGVSAENNFRIDDRRISRRCIQLDRKDGAIVLEDLGQRNGVLVNGGLVDGPVRLRSGDVITFGQVENLSLIYRADTVHEVLPELLSRLEEVKTEETGDRSLRNMGLLLEATALLQSTLPYEEVLGAMVDRAIKITDADRGLLLEARGEEDLEPLVARQQDGTSLPTDDMNPSRTVIAQAVEKRESLVELDVKQAGEAVREARSVVQQKLRAVVAIPLCSRPKMRAGASSVTTPSGKLLGLLYLDSRRPAAFSSLERQILDALAAESASVIENAQLLKRERERRRMEQELAIAREIQQALLPKGVQSTAFCKIAAVNLPCYAVGGDYFDLIEMGHDRIGIVLADVSGKGLPAALLTSMLQGCFSGMTLGCGVGELVNHVNRFACSRSDTHRYATLFFGVLDDGGRLEYINAGHHSPLLVRGDKVSEPFEAQGPPLGLLEGTEYKSSTYQLEHRDQLVLFTDGVTEAVNPADEEYGLFRLFKHVKSNAGKPVEKLQQSILSAVHEFADGTEQADDITVLTLRYNKVQ